MKQLEWNRSDSAINTSVHFSQSHPVKNKKKIILIISLSLFTSLSQFIMIQSCNKTSSKFSTPNVYAVAVSNRNIKKGEKASEENIKLIYMDVGNSKDSYILNSELNSYLGQKFLVNSTEETPILKNVFTNKLQSTNISENIPAGKRLFSLEADLGPLNSVLHVGSKVDIIAHLDIPDFGKVTENVLESIEIIGIGDNLESEEKSNPDQFLSFYVTPEEVKILSFMKQYAHFSIALRNPNDLSSHSSSAVTFNKFIQDERIQKIMKNDSFKIIK